MAHRERNDGVELLARTGKLLTRGWRRGIFCRHMGCRWYLSHTISFNDPTRKCRLQSMAKSNEQSLVTSDKLCRLL